MKYQAILFDVDGTLLDTTEYIYGAFEYSLQKNSFPVLPRSEMGLMMGKSLKDCYIAFTKTQDVKDLMQDHHQFQLVHPELSHVYKGAIETLLGLLKAGYRLSTITSRSGNIVLDTLKRARIDLYFEHIITLDDVQKEKPDPEGILKALQKMDIAPQKAIMVGDSPVDIEAGKNAGTKTVGAAYGFHGAKIAESNPDYVIKDIGEVINLLDGMKSESL